MPRGQVSCALMCELFVSVSVLVCSHVDSVLSACCHFPAFVWIARKLSMFTFISFDAYLLHFITQVIYVGNRVSIFETGSETVETGSVASSNIWPCPEKCAFILGSHAFVKCFLSIYSFQCFCQNNINFLTKIKRTLKKIASWTRSGPNMLLMTTGGNRCGPSRVDTGSWCRSPGPCFAISI